MIDFEPESTHDEYNPALSIRTLFSVAVAVAVEYAIADVTWQWLLNILSISQMVICIGVCMAIEIKAGYYECPECGH